MEEYRPVSRHKWFALGCLTSFILIGLLVAILVTIGVRSTRTITAVVKPDSYLHLQLTGPIAEYNEIRDDFIFETETASVHELIRKIHAAQTDSNIRGILLEPRGVVCGSAVADRLGQALLEFRDSGKDVTAYIEDCGDRDYYLCTFANRIVMNPSASASIMLTGVGSSLNYYKRLLDKLGIEFKVVHAGKYKGTGEPYVLDAMSPEFRENLTGVLDSTYVRKLKTIAENRKRVVEQEDDINEDNRYEYIRKIYEERPSLFITADKAREMGLIDETAYRQDLLKSLRADGHLVKASKYDREPAGYNASNRVAVVYLQGEIMGMASEWQPGVITAERFDKIATELEKDSSTRAVVLRVNSPGGSALESEIIHHRIEQLKTHKKVVVSMGNVAASGGYYISSGADAIFADPYTITGSIGVVSAIPNLSKGAAKLGVTPQTVSRGKFANAFDPMLPFNPNDVNSLQAHSITIYEEFKSRVAEGRKMTPDQVEAIAQGRVWSGAKAKEIGLVDEVGTLDEAVAKAATLAGLKSFGTDYYPETHTVMETILKDRLNINTLSTALHAGLVEDWGNLPVEVLMDAFRREPVQLLAPALNITE
jgi:protease-4